MNNTIRQTVRHVDYEHRTALVLNKKGKAYSVNLSDKVMHDGIQAKDIAHIRIINGVWIVVDFEKRYSSENDEYAWADAELMGEY